MSNSKWRRWARVLFWALLAAGAVWLVRVALWRPLALTGEAPQDPYTRARGVVHIHTTCSDGGGTPEEVIREAKAAGLDFIGITEHNNLDPKSHEGYRDGVLVLVGAEISTPVGHLLGLGLDRDPAFRFNGDGLDALEDVRDLGGVAFAAHPFSNRADFRWNGWDLPGPWGIELINGDSEWRRAGGRLLLTAGLYHLNPQYALLQSLLSPDPALERWDTMLAERDVVGLAGADAHSRLPITKRIHLRVPAYQQLFRLNQIHLLLDRALTGDLDADRAAVLGAIRRGRLYLGLDGLADAGSFGFSVLAGERRHTMGESLPFQGGARAIAGGRLPAGTRLALLRDGRPLASAVGGLEVTLPGPGVYRVEARVPGWSLPWVITNPIYVQDEAERRQREATAAWPPPPMVRAVELLAALPGNASFTPEFDPTSWMDPQVAVPEGPDGRTALRLGFRLAPPGPSQPFTWCALVNRQPRDLSSFTGLRFEVRGDGEYRSWIQIRDANPQSADEGLEWWLASVRTTTQWREVRLPFTRFRTINPKTDGRLDLDQARALVFVLDHASVKPGTQGTIWLSDLGFYR